MELLFEYQESRRRVNPPSSEAVVECILEEIRKFDHKASLLLGSANKDDDAKPPADSEYVLQKWSQKWGVYIDVTKLEEVEDGDKLTAIPKPTRAYSVSDSCCSYAWYLVSKVISQLTVLL